LRNLSRPDRLRAGLSKINGKRDRDVIKTEGGRECRDAEMKPKKFPVSSITTIYVERLFLECVFMLNTGTESNFIKIGSIPDAQIFREDKLHIV